MEVARGALFMRIVYTYFVAGLLGSLLVAASGCGNVTESEAQAKATATAAAPSSPSEAGKSGKPATRPDEPIVPQVVIETTFGNITVTLDYENTFLTADNFLQYVESGDYNGTIFHQTFPGYAILGGACTPDLKEKPSVREIFNESLRAKKNTRGTIAMARRPEFPDSATRQFFINVSDNASLDHQPSPPGQITPPEQYGYCVFGQVTSGMEVVDRIAAVATQSRGGFESVPVETVLIKSIRRIR
jgi:cyclophilin family peptidyl-prolyl cis-trans isomerase